MKKTVFISSILLFAVSVANVNAQTTTDRASGSVAPSLSNWTRSGNAGVSLAQTSYTNWSAGGDSSVAMDMFLNYSADYQKNKWLWINRLELAYGLSDTKSTGTRKTNDRIFLSSSYGYGIANNLYAAALLTFNTQFAKGYDYAASTTDYISRFMAPGYLSLGLGVIWTPKTWLRVTASPATYRATFVLDDKLSELGSFGVDPGKRIRNEFGANLRGEVNFLIMQNVTLFSRLDLFSNYFENPQNVDVNWLLQLNMKVNKWISANFSLNMLYDDDIRINDNGPRLQVQEMIGIGLQVNF